MKKNEFIILFGLILLGFSVHEISHTIYTIAWYDFKNYTFDWYSFDTLFTIFYILAPIVVLGIGAVVRFIEKKQRDIPVQIMQQVSKVIENVKYCPSCGIQNPKSDQFCINCGEKFPVI